MLLTNYGFAISNNKYNYCRLKIPLTAILQQSQVKGLDGTDDMYSCVSYKFKSNLLNLKFLETLRSLLWDQSMPVEAFFKPFSWDFEEKILTFAIELLNSQVGEYETSIEEDYQIIQKPKSHRHYFAVLFN
jgi:Rubisco LSMT substrate-binding